ncbi:hypothetical protein [Paludisphaera borealis]|uniref:Glycosyltransferase RgtA/B/C/D-like domain-containing protein n=1 Tax=Paludisphaera borealis TaxID=1387353 RepID=A0A1U7CXX4_9BACT|nr:hypothetical protein [Paludisphaera borealis]APW63756.1 hypothetical protein BSF38_05332 [Paludisphaera borealis]
MSNADLDLVVEPRGPRPEPRRIAGSILIVAAVGLALGILLRQPTMMGANDISRWCTVWSLVERGTYVIDDCPWQSETQDKIQKAIGADGQGEKHYFSSKPALLSTVIAAMVYPARVIAGVPLEKVVLQEREPRWGQVPDETKPGKVKGVLTTPDQPVKWPVFIFYFKPVLIALNILPFWGFLVLFGRLLDRYAKTDWAWFFSLTAAAFGTYLLPFTQTLNNHTLAAFSAFFALYQFLRIWDEHEVSAWRFATVGFLAGFAATNELPAAAFVALLGGLLVFRFPAKTLAWFLPFAAIPILALMTSQYAAFGKFALAYEEFGTEAYLFEGSLWKTPLELDALNVPWLDPEEAARRGIVGESYGLYLFHMTFGHHGFWSLTPIFLFAAAGLVGLLRGSGKGAAALAVGLVVAGLGVWGVDLFRPDLLSSGGALHPYLWVGWVIAGLTALLGLVIWLNSIRDGGKPMAAVAWMTLALTLILFAFYTWNPKARNYGGATQGLRWLFWLIPFWLLMLPSALDAIADRPWLRKLAMLALFVSVLSVGYSTRGPWSNPWIQDMIEHMGLYSLRR